MKKSKRGNESPRRPLSVSSEGVSVIVLEEFPEPVFRPPGELGGREFVNFVKSIERIVRGSYEYRKYIRFLISEGDLSRCTFFRNVDVKELRGVHLEFHHHPYTLYDIVEAVLAKAGGPEGLGVGGCLSVAEETVRLHYEGKAGLVPLVKTAHQLFHSGELFIPTSAAHGDVASFTEEYWEHLSDAAKTKVATYSEMSWKYGSIGVLERNVTLLSVPDRKAFQEIVRAEAARAA